MNRMRARALTHFPSVLLTLISIIQALALELLWSEVVDNPWLFEADLDAFIGWGMVAACFLGVLLIWIIYATMVMGFKWLPYLRDSILPFVLGIQQFMLVSIVAEQFSPLWLYVLASVFVSANWVTHNSLRRARQEPENAVFFNRVAPATLRDFLPAFAIVFAFVSLGVAIEILALPALALISVLLANGILLFQLFSLRHLWREIMNTSEESD